MKTISQIPAISRAVMAQDGHGSVSVVSRSTPTPGKGEVLVRMAAAPVNPSDLTVIHNYSGNPRRYPTPAGREGSGQVVASGGGLLARYMLGKRVAVSGGDSGTWAEYTVVPATACAPLRSQISYEQGSMLLVNPLTAIALLERAKAGGHHTIANTATTGAFGGILREMARRKGLAVVEIVRREDQVRQLKQAGARHVLDSSDPDFRSHLRRLAKELDLRMYFDAVGGTMTGHLVDASPHGSTIILYAVLSREDPTFPGFRLLNDDKRIEGFYLGNWTRNIGTLRLLRALARAGKFLESGYSVRIGEKFLLSEIEAALTHARQKASLGRSLLVLDPDAVSIKNE